MLPVPILLVCKTFDIVALPFPLGFTTANRIVYAVFLDPPDRVKAMVIVVPRLTVVLGLIDRVYDTAETVGIIAITTASTIKHGTPERSLISP